MADTDGGPAGTPDTTPDTPGAPRAAGTHRAARPGHAAGHGAGHGAGFVLLFTVLGALLPGLGLVVAGWRKVGALVLAVWVAGLVVLGVRVGSDPVGALGALLDGGGLRTLEAVTVVVGVAWAVLVVCTYRALRPARTSTGRRVAMSAVVGVLCLLILAPTAYAASLVNTTDRTIRRIFTDPLSATVSKTDAPGEGSDPWADKPRLNVLLLGGDAGPDRTGLRTDTVIVASIDTHTGNTVLFSVGRNTQRLQFQPGTPLAEKYPGGYATNPDNYTTGNISDNWLDSAYQNIPEQHPGLLGPTDNEGADALKLGLGYSLFGNQNAIDYYVLISLQGFTQVVNALGGITVNVNSPVPIGGAYATDGSNRTVQYPSRWIMPGPDQKLGGHDALWFARGRYGGTDRDRVERQRCTINAITNQATPARVLESYTSLADSAAKVTQTDIPPRVFPSLLQLANTVKSAKRSSLSIDSSGIPDFDQFTPDWKEVRAVVQTAVARSNPAPKPTATAAPTTPVPGTIPPATAVPIPTPTTSSSGVVIDPDLDSSCAYDPAAAKANLAAWENTWSGRYTSDGTPR